MNQPQAQPKKKGFPQLTITDLLKQNHTDPIWVVNETRGEQRGNVFFQVSSATQGAPAENVAVHSSFVAQNLTEQVTRRQLLDSSNFKRAVNRGMIRIVSEEEAQSILAQPGAAQEAERVRRLDISSITNEAGNGMGNSLIAEEKAKEGISTPVVQFAELMETNSEIEALNSLRSLGRLDLASYRYVNRKAKDINYRQVGQYCSEQIKAIKAEVAADDGDDE